jgi:hypothetical protein
MFLKTFFLFLVAGGILTHCKVVPDSEQNIRESYVREVVEQDHQQFRYQLVSRSEIEFHSGWLANEFALDAGSAWRWMGKRGRLKLRSRTNGADDTLMISGWTPAELRQPQNVSVWLNEREIAAFEAFGLYDWKVEIPKKWLPPPGETFEVELRAEAIARSWVDTREFALAVSSIRLASWVR